MMNRIHLQPTLSRRDADLRPGPSAPPAKGAFANVLQGALRETSPVEFSAHALRRMENRGIRFSPSDEGRIGRALDRAVAKGARESLLLMDRCALVVSVPNRKVITVVPSQELNLEKAVDPPINADTHGWDSTYEYEPYHHLGEFQIAREQNR